MVLLTGETMHAEKSRPVSGHTQAFKAVATRLRPDLVAIINFFKFQGGEQEEDQHGVQEMYPGEAAWDAFAKEHLGPRVIGEYVKDGDRFRMVQRVWGS